ncbi:sensor histidine kinase [Spirosoma spitsbergense]|uniref:sensor histidine kinase n=1 Tax=Spirosoma spitsbergense TaxID=431554 RepID=UPI0003691404|nr:sensor histidine kinase [Spirosoma spitsbergense]
MTDLPDDNEKNGLGIPVRFTHLYMTWLIILAILLTLGQVLTQSRIRSIQEALLVIRHAALQRHQSQQIVKQALLLADPSEQDRFAENVAELRRLFPIFEKYHLQSRVGNISNPKVRITNSDTVQRLYAGIRPQFEAFQQSNRRLMRLQRPDEIKQPDVQASLRLLLANEKPFLEKMDGIVVEYNTELRNKLNVMQSVEFYLYLFTGLVLIGIGWLIFRPAAQKLKQAFEQLIEAESQTTAANKKLLSANKSLKETRQKLFDATKQQYEQQIDEQKIRTSYLIAGQEEERKRLSRELHDGLGQMLTAIKLQIEGLEAGLTRAASEQNTGITYSANLRTLKSLVTQTIQETRTISNNLMPSVLSDFGVVPAIKMLADHDRSETMDVTFKTNLATNGPRLDKNIEIMLYRVTQEAVSNAVRHANPTHITIELKERRNSLQLVISDDGMGFQMPEKKQLSEQLQSVQELNNLFNRVDTSRPPSQGLQNIQERTKLVNGKFKINSRPGKGTKLQISIPYQTRFAQYDTY